MRADYPTKLSLWEWARILQIHPLHFAQINYGEAVHCAAPYMQYAWQDVDRVSRDEIAQAILEAETIIERQLGYRLLPSWESEEVQRVEKPTKPELVNFTGTDQRGYRMPVQANWGHVIAGGIRGTTLLGTPSITWLDEDGDLVEETGRVVINGLASTVLSQACEVRLFFADKLADAAWEIKPIKSISLSGGTLTVTFRRELAVKPELEETFTPEGVLWTDDASFIDELDVYRVYNNPATQVSFLWEPIGGCSCVGQQSCAQCSFVTQSGCLLPRDFRTGIFHLAPATYDADDDAWTATTFSDLKAPDAARLYYYAGLQDKGQSCGARDMDRSWKLAIARLAASMLDRPPCDCSADQWHQWREDLSLDRGSEDYGIYRTPRDVLGNPFGTRRGAVMAWRRVRDLGQRIGQGVGVG